MVTKTDKGGSKRLSLPYNPDNYCEQHDAQGHNADECILLKRELREAREAAGSQHMNTKYQ